jgi:AcrR family transcriptional regulator
VKARSGTPRGRPRDAALDGAILGAALALFREHGAEGVSIERTAERAGVTRGTVYRRWATRDALVASALGRARAHAERSLGPLEQASFAAMVAWLVETLPRALARPATRKLLARLIGSATSAPELLATYWKHALAPRRRAFVHAAERARAQRQLPHACEPELLGDLIAGALLCEVLIRPGRRSQREIRDYLRRVLRQLGVSLPSARAPRGSRSRERARRLRKRSPQPS